MPFRKDPKRIKVDTTPTEKYQASGFPLLLLFAAKIYDANHGMHRADPMTKVHRTPHLLRTHVDMIAPNVSAR